MKPGIFTEEAEVIQAVHYLPSVSIIVPFEPKMMLKSELEYRLQRTVDKVEKDLRGNYSADKASPVLDKLKNLVKKLDYSTYKKSIAIYVSPLVEKVYYLEIPVEEKIIVDESFEIRDLVFSKKDIHKYLVLVLSSERSRLYLGNTTRFVRIALNTPEQAVAYHNDIPERVGNFSDPSERKEVLLDKFLRHVDGGLGVLLQAYGLPMFVMGTDKTIGHFKNITHHTSAINGYVHGNFEHANEAEIRKAIAPHVADWKKVKQDDMLHRLDAAAGAKKLVTGIQNVWKEAMHRRGRLLVVEKNYIYAAEKKSSDEIAKYNNNTSNGLYINDAVDEIIEKVLESGGDVEFVDEGILKDYAKIALVMFY